MNPPLSPFHVDMTRFGSSHATSRKPFGAIQAPQAHRPAQAAPPRPQPPPRRIDLGGRPLGQGKPGSPTINPDVLASIQTTAGHAVDTLRLELEASKSEANMVSPETLRTQPDLYKSIPDVGPYLSPQEIRNVIILDSQDVMAQAQRLLSGASAAYITADQRSILNTVVSDANALIKYLQSLDLADLRGANAKLAQDHATTHVKDAKALVDSVEQQVVSGEAGAVPVVEPGESAGGPGTLLALGALVAVGFILVEIW